MSEVTQPGRAALGPMYRARIRSEAAASINMYGPAVRVHLLRIVDLCDLLEAVLWRVRRLLEEEFTDERGRCSVNGELADDLIAAGFLEAFSRQWVESPPPVSVGEAGAVTFGAWLRSRREALGLSRGMALVRMTAKGHSVALATIENWERGRTFPSRSGPIRGYLRVLGCEAEGLAKLAEARQVS